MTAPQTLAGLFALGVCLVGLACARPEAAYEAAVIGATFVVGIGAVGVAGLFGGGR